MESTLLKWEKLCRTISKLIWPPSFKTSTSIQNQHNSLKNSLKICFKTHYRPFAHKQFPTMKTGTLAYVQLRTPNKSISTIPYWSSMCSFITIAAWEFGWLKTFWICWRKNSFMRLRPRSGYLFRSISKCLSHICIMFKITRHLRKHKSERKSIKSLRFRTALSTVFYFQK